MKSCLLLCSLVLACCAVAHAEEIIIEGGGAATSRYFSPFKEPYEDATKDMLIIKKTSPVDGLISVEKGLADAATAAVSLESMLKGAAEKGVTIDPATLKSIVVGENHTLIFVNKDVEILSLNKEQLKGIFTGKITNWKEVGAQDMPIEVIWGSKTPGQNALFSKVVLDDEPVTDKATPATDYADIRLQVVKRPGAIGIDPEGFKTGALKIPESPDIISPINVVTKGEPSAKVKKVLDFIEAEELSDKGHKHRTEKK